jgi:hypothetical protein
LLVSAQHVREHAAADRFDERRLAPVAVDPDSEIERCRPRRLPSIFLAPDGACVPQ